MKTSKQLTQIDSLLRIGEFAFKQGNASLVASEVTHFCDVCGVIEPRLCTNGYLRSTCACESLQREKEALAQVKQDANDYHAARCYSWLGKITYHKLERHTFQSFNPGGQVEQVRDEKGKLIEHDYRAKFRENKRIAQWYAEQIINKAFPGNLLLRGNPGTGKTHLACAILNECRANHIPCLYCKAQDLFNVDFTQLEKARVQASTTPLLVLNDIDKVYIKSHEDSEREGQFQKLTLFNIIDNRYDADLPTIITTNAQGSLLMWLREESVSRLMEGPMTVLDMTGIDYRLPRGGKS
jgi:DNA replication protein DnaC